MIFLHFQFVYLFAGARCRIPVAGRLRAAPGAAAASVRTTVAALRREAARPRDRERAAARGVRARPRRGVQEGGAVSPFGTGPSQAVLLPPGRLD